MVHHAINIPHDHLAEICRRYGAKRLSLFGSVLTDQFGPESDVDMLVEFLPDAQIGLFEMSAMEEELSSLIGRKVDLRTPADLSRYFRDEVMQRAVMQYAAWGNANQCGRRSAPAAHARCGANGARVREGPPARRLEPGPHRKARHGQAP